MIRTTLMIPRLVAITALLAIAMPASGQTLLFWDVDVGNWKDESSWFGGFTPPEAFFGEAGVVNNAGIAFVDSTIASGPGGIILGEGANQSGTLEIRSGGEFTVKSDFDVAGDVRVGQAGTGTLIVERGGTLEAEILRSGGRQESSIILGTGNSGTTKVIINAAANLARHTRVIGPNVDFESETLSLGGTFTSEITGLNHSTFDVNDAASLGGVLDLQFVAPFQPQAGQTWNLIDAKSISGNFSSVTSNVSPGPGLAFSVSAVPGGTNGMLAQVGIDAKLLLTVDRRSGETHIQNLAEQQSISINGYGITSGGGGINNNNWQQLSGGGPWSGNGSSTHVAEVSLTGSLEVGPGTDINMGNIYSFTPTTLGETLEDVTFEYHIAGGDVVNGLIDYTGPHNDVVLVVDEDGVFIQNQSTQDVTINGYAVVSQSGALDPGAWTSFASTDTTFTEANAANNHITELNLSGSRVLEATSGAIPLGPIFTSGSEKDLTFMVNIAGVGPYTGLVEYDDGVIQFGGDLPGDCNGDGAVNAADLACVGDIAERDIVLAAIPTLPGDLDGNGDVGFQDFLVLSANFGQDGLNYTQGNIDLVGTVAFPDFLVLSTNFNKTAAGASPVPEPSSAGVIVLGTLFASLLRKRRIFRDRA